MKVTLQTLREAAQEALSRLETLPQDHAAVLALSGELGAGKTSLTQAIAHELGIEESVTSPTFVIEKIYELPGAREGEALGFRNYRWKFLIHIDAYRLNSKEELKPLGWDDVIANSENLVIVEWPSNVAGAFPPDAVFAELVVTGETSRELSYA